MLSVKRESGGSGGDGDSGVGGGGGAGGYGAVSVEVAVVGQRRVQIPVLMHWCEASLLSVRRGRCRDMIVNSGSQSKYRNPMHWCEASLLSVKLGEFSRREKS